MRFLSRHFTKTLQDFTLAELTSKGWITPGSTNFGATPVEFIVDIPEEPIDLPENLVVADIDGPSERILVELGGMEAIIFGVSFDVYCRNPSIAMSIAEDLKDSFHERTFPLKDYTSNSNGVNTSTLIHCNGVELNREGSVNRGAEQRTLINVLFTTEMFLPQ